MRSELSPAMKRALRKVKRHRFCAHWLISKVTIRALLRRRLIVPCGFYSVCLPETPRWSLVSYAEPERAFDP
jgi:hypothetical protein